MAVTVETLAPGRKICPSRGGPSLKGLGGDLAAEWDVCGDAKKYAGKFCGRPPEFSCRRVSTRTITRTLANTNVHTFRYECGTGLCR